MDAMVKVGGPRLQLANPDSTFRPSRLEKRNDRTSRGEAEAGAGFAFFSLISFGALPDAGTGGVATEGNSNGLTAADAPADMNLANGGYLIGG